MKSVVTVEYYPRTPSGKLDDQQKRNATLGLKEFFENNTWESVQTVVSHAEVESVTIESEEDMPNMGCSKYVFAIKLTYGIEDDSANIILDRASGFLIGLFWEGRVYPSYNP